MKEAIIKSAAAILCAVIVCVAVLSAVGTYSEAQVKAAEITASSFNPPVDAPADDMPGTSAPEKITLDEDTTDTPVTDESSPDSDTSDEAATDTDVTVQPSSDPSEWTKEQIVAEYKKAATKSNASTKSQHKISIEEIKVNGKAYDGITGLIGKLLANNSEDKDGITGGHENLVADDVASAKAYKSGNNTVIEMTMKDQVAGPAESDKSGSVGHAITVVGDISAVTKQITDLGFPLDINEKETRIYYTKPTVKVVINEDGKIINGTWQYTVEISLKNYTVLKNVHIDSTSILMVNTLSVNGGFKK